MKNLIEQIKQELPAALIKRAEIDRALKDREIVLPFPMTTTEIAVYFNKILDKQRGDFRSVLEKDGKVGEKIRQPERLEKLNRSKRLILSNAESTAKTEENFQELGFKYSGETETWAALILGILAYFDKAREENPDFATLRKNVNAVSNIRNIDYQIFICPSINVTPDGTGYYIYPDPERTAIYTNRDVSKQLLSLLKYAGAIPNLLVFIGDTDDADYIYPAIGNPKNFDWAERDKQIRKMRENTDKLVRGKLKLDGSVISWFLDMPQKPNNVPVSQPDIVLSEETRIAELFSDGNFYGSMVKPDKNQITRMAELKVDTYGYQGRQIKTIYNPVFGIQTETPSLLRSEMLNTLNGDERIPFIYPYIFKP